MLMSALLAAAQPDVLESADFVGAGCVSMWRALGRLDIPLQYKGAHRPYRNHKFEQYSDASTRLQLLPPVENDSSIRALLQYNYAALLLPPDARESDVSLDTPRPCRR